MLPDWMKSSDDFVPPKDGGTFIIKTIKAISKALTGIRIQRGHEKNVILSPFTKLLLLLFLIAFVSLCHNRLILMGIAAAVLIYLCRWPGEDIVHVFGTAVFASVISLIMFLPAMIFFPSGIANYLRVTAKVFLCASMVGIFNHTTQWNHITMALRKLHVPKTFVFVLDITLKYIVILGNYMTELLTSVLIRSVGKNKIKHQSAGQVMGLTFIAGIQLGRQTFEAMTCRGYTDG